MPPWNYKRLETFEIVWKMYGNCFCLFTSINGDLTAAGLVQMSTVIKRRQFIFKEKQRKEKKKNIWRFGATFPCVLRLLEQLWRPSIYVRHIRPPPGLILMSYQLVQLWLVIKQEEQYESKRTRKKNNKAKRDARIWQRFFLRNTTRKKVKRRRNWGERSDGDRLTGSRVDAASCDWSESEIPGSIFFEFISFLFLISLCAGTIRKRRTW